MKQPLHIGTSGWSYKDWLGVYYPDGIKQSEYLMHYSKEFNTVEIDSTFYAVPRVSTVENWYNRTPNEFIMSPKVHQVITHEKRLKDCRDEWQIFIETMQLLKHKLGPVVLQFDYKFNFSDHFEALKNFLTENNQPVRLCVEIRNRDWHNPAFYDLLRDFNIALVLNDLYYMPRVTEITAEFTYIRLLGNRKQIPDDFSHVRINRDKDIDWWANWIEQFIEKELEVYVYSNNRYQGHAPATVRSLLDRFVPERASTKERAEQ